MSEQDQPEGQDYREAQSSQSNKSAALPVNTDFVNDTGDAREAIRVDLEDSPNASDLGRRSITVVEEGQDFEEVRFSAEFREVAAQNPALLFAQTNQLDTTAGGPVNTEVMISLANGIETVDVVIEENTPVIPKDSTPTPDVPYVSVDNQTGKAQRVEAGDEPVPSDSALQPQARAYGDTDTPTPVVPSSDIPQSQPDASPESVAANTQANDAIHTDPAPVATPGGAIDGAGNNQTLDNLSADPQVSATEAGAPSLVTDNSATDENLASATESATPVENEDGVAVTVPTGDAVDGPVDPGSPVLQTDQLDTTEGGGNNTADGVLVDNPTQVDPVIIDGETGQQVDSETAEAVPAEAIGTNPSPSPQPVTAPNSSDEVAPGTESPGDPLRPDQLGVNTPDSDAPASDALASDAPADEAPVDYTESAPSADPAPATDVVDTTGTDTAAATDTSLPADADNAQVDTAVPADLTDAPVTDAPVDSTVADAPADVTPTDVPVTDVTDSTTTDPASTDPSPAAVDESAGTDPVDEGTPQS